jgi:hypothetical protein
MTKVVRAIVGTALSLCLVTALGFAGAPRGSDKSPVRVGDFAIQLADAMNIKHDGTPGGAKKALGDLGIRVGDPNATLTEGKLVSLLGNLGIQVKSSSTGRAVTGGKAEAVVKTFQRELRRAAVTGNVELAGNGDDDFNNGNGKGGKFKRKANLSPGGKGDD